MIHVYPLGDLETHVLEGTQCKCNPRIETENEIIVVHNSFDGREAVERANSILGLDSGLPPDDQIWKGVYE